MIKRTLTSSNGTKLLWQLAAAIVLFGLLESVTQAGVFVSFEQSEGFPAVGNSFEGTTDNNGITWSSMNVTSLTTDSGTSGLGFPNDPSPLTGTQTAFALSDVKGKAMIEMDLDNSANLTLSSVNYAFNNQDQVTFFEDVNGIRNFAPSRFQIDYYDTNDQFIGTNAFGYGPDPRVVGGLSRLGWSAGIADYSPKFQQFSPTDPFEGVALGKVVFKSFHDIQNSGDLIPRGRDFPDGPKSGTFHLEDITLSPATTTFSERFPANTYRVSFETSDSFIDVDGLTFARASDQFQEFGTPIPEGFSTVPGIDSITGDDADGGNGYGGMTIDHGWAERCRGRECQASTGGNLLPAAEPDPIHGEQMLIVGGGGAPQSSVGNMQLDFDLDNGAQLALDSFYFGYRGNGTPDVIVEYFDLSEQSLGTETFNGSDDGGAGLGLSPEFWPEFDEIKVGSPASSNLTVGSVVGTPLSRVIITVVNPNATIGQSTAFELDNMLFVCTSGNCPEPFVGMPCDFDTSGSCDATDINFLADSVRNGITDPRLNLDGIGGDIPNDADFEFYITDEAYLGSGLGDHDLNRIVNFADFVIISNNFGISGLRDGGPPSNLNTGGRRTGWAEGNGNPDVTTNFVDFVNLSNNFGMNFTSGGDNIPEPASLAITVAGVLALGRRWKRAKSRRI